MKTKTVENKGGSPILILNTQGKSTASKVLLFLMLFVIMTAAGICLGIMSLYFSAGLYSKELLSYYLEQPSLVFLNTLPYLMICYLLWAITNRAWVGFAVGGTSCLVYSFAEYWKLLSRDDPVYAEDLAVAKEALQMSADYIKITPVMILSVLLVIGGIIFLFLLFRKTKVFSWLSRVIISLVILALCGGLYTTVYTSKDVYDSFVVWEPLNVWFENNNYISRGGIYPFIYSIRSALPEEPEGYDQDEAEELLLGYQTDDITKKASVIVVMYEAFADLSEETNLITEGDPYAAYHQLKDESYSGKLVTNVFAGGTINTERSVLTGFSELTSFRRESWSYARYFAEQGYSLNGSHGGYQAFYNRINVNRNLGFDQYYFIENYYSQFTDWVPMDYILLPEITRICLEDIAQGNQVFSFNVTYQNHGPYSTEMLESTNVYIQEGVINSTDYAIANNYLTGIADTGEKMLTMADAFRDLGEPVILVFFGDHKPWLGDAGSTPLIRRAL